VIWLTWRQYRAQFAVILGALVAVAIVLAVTGPHLASLSDGYLKACRAAQDCGSTPNPVLNTDGLLETGLDATLLILPALLGIFWGAPLIARELETGTHRLSWTQSVSRRRWLAVKVGLVGLATVVVAGLFSLMVTWWSSPIDQANANRFGPAMFALRDITPIGYAAFAFVLGVTAGVLMRRTLPSMASTLVAYIAVRLGVTYWVRPHLLSPSHTTASLSKAGSIGFSLTPTGVQLTAGPPNITNAWVYSSNVVDSTGQAPTTQFIKTACPNLPAGPPAGGGGQRAVVSGGNQGAFHDCLVTLGTKFHEVVTYQPASHFWDFQVLETALYLVLAALLTGLCFWWVRHRLS
jgi:hypothetical protein